jgi:hypothetical protein
MPGLRKAVLCVEGGVSTAARSTERIVLEPVNEDILQIFRHECYRQGIPEALAFEEAVVMWILSLFELRNMGRNLVVDGDEDVVDNLSFIDNPDLTGTDF